MLQSQHPAASRFAVSGGLLGAWRTERAVLFAVVKCLQYKTDFRKVKLEIRYSLA